MSITGYYDRNASKIYSEALKFGFLYNHVHPFTVFHYLGDLSGKSILDVGCGNGNYCRRFKAKGAAEVVGVDCSHSMIDIARQMEEENPLGCQYFVADAEHDEEVIGQFDIVVGVFLLVYANSYESLKKFCSFLHRNVKPGGICLAVILNCFSNKFLNAPILKYGYNYSFIKELPKGGYQAKVKVLTGKQDKFLELINYCFPPDIYEKSFKEVGFKSFQFKKFLHDSKFPDEFWKDYDENQSEVIILAEN